MFSKYHMYKKSRIALKACWKHRREFDEIVIIFCLVVLIILSYMISSYGYDTLACYYDNDFLDKALFIMDNITIKDLCLHNYPNYFDKNMEFLILILIITIPILFIFLIISISVFFVIMSILAAIRKIYKYFELRYRKVRDTYNDTVAKLV